MPQLTERDLIDGFEQCTLDPSDFNHIEHVRLAWLYLREEPVASCLVRMRDATQRFAAHHGAHDLYHETITWAFVLLVNERMASRFEPCGRDADESWDAFAARNPDLLTYHPSILKRYYLPETLASPLAKKVFVWPDRVGAAKLGQE